MLATDPFAELPAFMQYLDSLVARATNALIGHWEGFFSSEVSYSNVTHGSTDDVVAKAAYILANPVAAGLVQHGHEWPGVWTAPEQLGATTLTIKRPAAFFSENMPDSVELTLTVPPGFESVEHFQEAVRRATRDLEAEHRRKAQAAQRSFLGRTRVLRQNPHSRPTTTEPRRRLNPRIAARDEAERVEALEARSAFLDAYREAWAAMKAGRRDFVFPAGTYHLRVVHGVTCAAMV